MSYMDWAVQQGGLAAQMNQMKNANRMLPGQLAEQDVMNELKRQLLQQQQQAFPIQNEASKLSLQQAQQRAPQQQFADLVGTYGGNRGGEAFVQQQPELAQQLFSQGAEQGPPDVRGNAQAAGQQLYNLGPETARKIRGESEVAANRLPLEQALQNNAGRVQVDAFQKELPGRIQIAQAGLGASAAEHASQRQATAAGIAFQNFATNPALAQGLPALESTASAVKTEQDARTLINQIGALKAQIQYAGNSSTAIGAQMGADTSLDVKLQALTNAALARLDAIHRQLYNKYWGEAAQKTKSESRIDPFKIGMEPENTVGYTP